MQGGVGSLLNSSTSNVTVFDTPVLNCRPTSTSNSDDEGNDDNNDNDFEGNGVQSIAPTVHYHLDRGNNDIEAGYEETNPIGGYKIDALITFSHISCMIESSASYTDYIPFYPREKRLVLNDVSGFVKPGQLMAIIGPSGSGKTTMLDILAGRKQTGLVTGEVFVNGMPPGGPMWRRIAGYVMQDDTMYPCFTVRETLRYAARLRLPPSVSTEQKYLRVEQIIEELCLTEVADSLIGGDWSRGISGGEKRRVSIGIELVTDPSLIFLDEPTSGLDSYSACLVMELLHKMASTQNKTIICTIHQPSSSIFMKFDQLMLLAPQGRLIYKGPADEAVFYFASRGYPCPSSYNPSDFFLELVSTDANGKNARSQCEHSVQRLADSFMSTYVGISLTNELAQLHHRQEEETKYLQLAKRAIGGKFRFDGEKGEYANCLLGQFLVLSHRNILRYVRSPLMVVQSYIGYAFSALLLSILFSELKTNVYQQLTLGIGFLLNVFSVMTFFSIPKYQIARLLFNRERATGAYRTSAYYLSNSLCQLPIDFSICVIYSVVNFYLISLDGSFADGRIPFFILINFLTMQIYVGINETIGASLERVDTGLIIGGMTNVACMMFSGIIVQYPNFPEYITWAYWMTPLTYGLSAQLLNQFQGPDYSMGQMWLEYFGIQIWDKWRCVIYLAAMLVASRTCTYLVLRFLKKERR